jgi:hypothetical protein
LRLPASIDQRRDGGAQWRQVVDWNFVKVSAGPAEQVRKRAT